MRTAIATATFAGDFERCRLLCDSIDRRVTGFSTHYLLVEKADLALFSSLAGPRRVVVDERSLLPAWLQVVPDPLTLGRRRLWLSAKGLPLRGWHVQQLRKMALANGADEDAVLFCDSDTVFVRDVATDDLWRDGAFHFYRNPGAIGPEMDEHLGWSRRAGDLLGLGAQSGAPNDYIAQAVGWRTDTVRAMTKRIEEKTGRGWIAAVASRRSFSECLIYGRFVDEVENRPDRHAATRTPICHSYWNGSLPDASGVRRFLDQAGPDQPAVGFQSFIGADIEVIRATAGLAGPAGAIPSRGAEPAR